MVNQGETQPNKKQKLKNIHFHQYDVSTQTIWNKLVLGVNKTFLYVDRMLEANHEWLNSGECDLNDLEKNLLSAFNIDIRTTAIDSKQISVQHLGVDYTCNNGIFMIQVGRMRAQKGEPLPCFGEYSLVSNRPK